jgi:hypothetical protein
MTTKKSEINLPARLRFHPPPEQAVRQLQIVIKRQQKEGV